jgi:signal transduction histidine kinase/DNA-binding response OmpR family regulator
VAEPLRVLIVEDSAADAELLVLELRRTGFEVSFERMDDAAATTAALERGGWDVVIADFTLPGWSGLGALKLMRDREIDLPFIVVSGTIGEEVAVEAMKAGAHDYVLKHNLVRLGPAVRRELREAQVRWERREALARLRELATRSAFLAEASRKLASLNYDEILAEAARVALPSFADWCVVTVAEERPHKLHAELCHVDSAREAEARALLARYRIDARAQRGAANVMRTRQPEWTTAQSVLATAAPAGEDGRVVAALGHGAGLCVPLVSHGRVLGAFTLVRGPGRALEPDDIGFVQELGTRIAMALDNAGLYRQAREAILARDEFLSVASHELNTPLATLTLQMDELLRPGGRGRRDPDDASLMRARRQLDRLARLVGNLLDISRISARRMPLSLFDMDLAAVTREATEQFGPELERSGSSLRLVADSPVVGRWDALRLAQVVTNLLSNAVKYGAGKPIEVRVERAGVWALLTVRDHGIGIEPEQLDRIFEVFARAVPSRHYGGLGLGLYITRQVVEAHGGTIRVQSELGKGATFVVELPREAPSSGSDSNA